MHLILLEVSSSTPLLRYDCQRSIHCAGCTYTEGIANPTGAFLSAAMMLEWLGHAEAATEIRSGVCTVLAQHATPDAGGSLNTSEFTAAVIAQVV